MYQVVFLQNDGMTRNIKLENSNTGTIDDCFDDSSLVSDKCFDFMEIGGKYDCKIKLFGNVVQKKHEKSVLCKVVCRDIMIGSYDMAKIVIKNDEYYILQKKIENYKNGEFFYFRYSRKDLIQVNEVIHADFL